MDVLDWLLDGDPAIRWQVLRDLTDASAEDVQAERERIAAEGWAARLLALQGTHGQWAGGTYWPAADDDTDGQPWTATTYSLLLLRDFGLDPESRDARHAIELVRDNSRWEEGNQLFFDGEVEPCINGMTVALGAYFGQNVDKVAERLTREQLPDGGWNCEAERGSTSSATPPSASSRGFLNMSGPLGEHLNPARPGVVGKNTCWSVRCCGADPAVNLSAVTGCSFPTPPAGSTTSSAGWTTSGPPAAPRTDGLTRPSEP